MRQFVGSLRDGTTVRDLLLSVAPPPVRAAAAAVESAELAMMETDDEATQLRYAHALAEWGDAGGYDAEVLWDVCTTEALGLPFATARWREVGTLSGGEQKRLVLEALLRGSDQVLLLDEPDHYLDRQACCRLRAARADPADRAVRAGDLVRRTRRRARPQRVREVALPAAAGRRWQRPGAGPAPGRGAGPGAGGAQRASATGCAGAPRLVRSDTRAPGADRADPARHPVAW